MADGDIVTAQFTIDLDYTAADDSAVTTKLSALFPVATYALIHTDVKWITGQKGVVTIIAQAIA